MSNLPPTTRHRLQKLPQIPSVWEGDCRPLSSLADKLATETQGQEQCIIWVDGSEGTVRAMDVVSPEMGKEAIVRTLIRAIENPQSPSPPARPQKIIVRDREIQFFLRGVLQNLDINIEYVPEVPVIEEFFRGFATLAHQRPPTLPPKYEKLLVKTAQETWQEAPWYFLADHDILCIQAQHWDIEKLYVSVMGMLGQEYGILFYRSADTLKKFRSAVSTEESLEQLEKAFLAQDCWFVNFELGENLALEEEDIDLELLPARDISSVFGSVHPYEGMRPFLDEEEALIVYVALKALNKFVHHHKRQLEAELLELICQRFRISLPTKEHSQKKVAVE
ncbi:MAG: hypothetical protein F6K24_35350, partial [Okeania sp. SIO2D1]|nr:hypothetical protein [Okeania sp. SIO2D1]